MLRPTPIHRLHPFGRLWLLLLLLLPLLVPPPLPPPPHPHTYLIDRIHSSQLVTTTNNVLMTEVHIRFDILNMRIV